jgi:hypothetical protein
MLAHQKLMLRLVNLPGLTTIKVIYMLPSLLDIEMLTIAI